MKTSKPAHDRSAGQRIVETMEDAAARSETGGRRRAKTAKVSDRETGKALGSTWKCPTCRARKVFRRRHPR
jgi:hypothetical protein